MKRFLFLIFFFFSINMLGQYSVGPTVKYGWSDMPNNIESIRNSTNYTEFRPSYSIGILNEYRFNTWFAVELDILYDFLSSEQFYLVNGDNPEGYRSTTLNEVSYLSMPILLQFDYKKFSLHAGGQASYTLVWETQTVINDGFVNQNSYGSRSTGDGLGWNFAFTAALAYNVYDNLELEARFVKGLVNIMDPDWGFEHYASTTQFLVGLNYKFNFQKKKAATK